MERDNAVDLPDAGYAMPSLKTLIKEDFNCHREGLLAQGFWALFVYRLSAPRLRRPRGPVRAVWGIWAKIAAKTIEILCGISLPEGVIVGRRLRIEHFGGIIIHSQSVIGDDCVLRQNVTLGNRREDRPDEAPRVGDRVHLGAGAVILGHVTIGDDAIIGANAVVLCDVPPKAIAVGNPAKIKIRTEPPSGQ
jgi:serine O-acetyltransferase